MEAFYYMQTNLQISPTIPDNSHQELRASKDFLGKVLLDDALIRLMTKGINNKISFEPTLNLEGAVSFLLRIQAGHFDSNEIRD